MYDLVSELALAESRHNSQGPFRNQKDKYDELRLGKGAPWNLGDCHECGSAFTVNPKSKMCIKCRAIIRWRKPKKK